MRRTGWKESGKGLRAGNRLPPDSTGRTSINFTDVARRRDRTAVPEFRSDSLPSTEARRAFSSPPESRSPVAFSSEMRVPVKSNRISVIRSTKFCHESFLSSLRLSPRNKSVVRYFLFVEKYGASSAHEPFKILSSRLILEPGWKKETQRDIERSSKLQNFRATRGIRARGAEKLRDAVLRPTARYEEESKT